MATGDPDVSWVDEFVRLSPTSPVTSMATNAGVVGGDK
jgi:hypothetical protein